MNEKIIDYLKSKNINVIEEDIDSKLETWRAWYKGKVRSFHTYKVYNGQGSKEKQRLSLQMPSRVCKDWADLLLNEKVEITVNDKNTQKVLDRLLEQCNFYQRANNLIEAAFALGGGFFIQYWDGEKTAQKYVTQDFCYPITYDSGRLTEAAFVSNKTIAGEKYTYMETHLKDKNGHYVIDNVLLKGDDKGYKEADADIYEKYGIAPKIKTKSKTPLFQPIRPNVANKDKFDSPFGVSVFDDALDAIKSVDLNFDSFYKEMLLGKKRVYARDGVTSINFNEKGEQVKTFDPNEEVFYLLPGDVESENPIIESNMELRVSQINEAMQTSLNLISQLCGFGNAAYKWENGNVTTATQVVSENSKMFRNLKKHEIVLRQAIVNMAKGLLYFEKEYAKADVNLNAEISVNFDDSIIEDTAEIKRQAMSDYNLGLISAAEYFRQTKKLTDSQSKKYVKQMLKEIQEERAEKPTDGEDYEGA